MSTSKGLSDLISTVLLIAFGLTAAFILGTWFTDISRNVNDKNTQNLKGVGCSYTNFEVDEFTYQNGTNASFEFKLLNKGDNELYNFAVFTLGPNTNELTVSGGPTFNNTLKPGQIVQIQGFGNINASSFKIFSRACPAEYAEVKP